MSVADPNAALQAIKDSLAAKLVARIVSRSLKDQANLPDADQQAGVICVVNEGGDEFANYMGREGDLGLIYPSLVAYVKVAEDSEPEAVEIAELAILKDMLDWTNDQGAVRAGDSVLPISFTQSKQLEHPYGWVVLKLEVRP